MVSEFALSFTLDGMALARRTRTGEWRTLGSVAADSPVRGLEMRALAQRVRRHTGGNARVALLVPETEVLCIDLPGVSGGREAEAAAARALLEGRTPYAIDELCLDWVAAQGRLQVAAVACELLEELRALAQGAGFEVHEISAVLPPESFAGVPAFTLPAFTLPGEAAAPLAETTPETAAGGATPPPATAAPEPEAEPASAVELAPTPAPTPAAAPEPAAAVASGEAGDARAGEARSGPAAAMPDAGAAPKAATQAAPEPPGAVDETPAAGPSTPGDEPGQAARSGQEALSGAGASATRAGRRAGLRRPDEAELADVPAPVSFSSKRDSTVRIGRRAAPMHLGRTPPASGAPVSLGALPSAPGPDTARPRFSATAAGVAAASVALRAEAAPGVLAVGKAAPEEAGPDRRPSGLPLATPEPRSPKVMPIVQPEAPSAHPAARPGLHAPLGGPGLGRIDEDLQETHRMRRVAAAGVLVVALIGGVFWWMGGDSPGPGEGVPEDRAASLAPDAAQTGPNETIAAPSDLRIGTGEAVPRPVPEATPEPPPETLATTAPEALSPAPSDAPVLADLPAPAAQAEAPRAALPEFSAGSVTLETLAMPLAARRPLLVTGPGLPDYGAGPGDALPAIPGAAAALLPTAPTAEPTPGRDVATSSIAEAVAAAVAEAAGAAQAPGAARVDLRAGQPAIVPPARPATEPALAAPAPAPPSGVRVETATPDTLRPRARPVAAPVVAAPVAEPDGVPVDGTAATDSIAPPPAAAPASRPQARPAALVPAAETAPPQQQESRIAPSASPVPRNRPERITLASAPASAPVAAPVASILRPAPPVEVPPPAAEPTPEPPRTAAPAGPVLPTRAEVARAATEEGQIALRKISLVGVYGAPGDRRALVRLGNGRYVKIEVGDEIDGGNVAAIGERDITYVKRGEALRLAMPGDG